MTLCVLHVSESYGGGSATALRQYVRSTPEVEHHLLRSVRTDTALMDSLDERLFVSIADLPRSPIAAVGSIRSAVKSLRPAIVHAHSSFGGAYARAANVQRFGARLVYTPHCYAFERLDQRTAYRWVYRQIERILSHRTDSYAACSRREALLSGQIGGKAHIIFVPNIAAENALPAPRSRELIVCTVGRISNQKDPRFFEDVISRVSPEARALWIGGGDPDEEEKLRRAGVEVTGWISLGETQRLLRSSAVYVHTAAWEGFPMAILEAAAAGLPIAVRNIPAFHHMPASVRGNSPAEVAALVEALIRDDAAASANRSTWKRSLAQHNRAAQHDALMESYTMPELSHQ